jgi:hypothetical protein
MTNGPSGRASPSCKLQPPRNKGEITKLNIHSMPLWKHQKMIMHTSGFVKLNKLLKKFVGFLATTRIDMT